MGSQVRLGSHARAGSSQRSRSWSLAAGAENRDDDAARLPVGTRGRWEYKDGAFVFYNKRASSCASRAPTVESKAVARPPRHLRRVVSRAGGPEDRVGGTRGGWGVLETGKPSAECGSKTQVCRDRAAEKRATGNGCPWPS